MLIFIQKIKYKILRLTDISICLQTMATSNIIVADTVTMKLQKNNKICVYQH